MEKAQTVDPFDTTSSNTAGSTAPSTDDGGGGNNPFGFDADFQQGQQKRQTGGGLFSTLRGSRPATGRDTIDGGMGEGGEPILPGIDASGSADSSERNGSTKGMRKASPSPMGRHRRNNSDTPNQEGGSGGGGGGPAKPGLLSGRAKTLGGPGTPSSSTEEGGVMGSGVKGSIMAGSLASWLRGNKAADEDELTGPNSPGYELENRSVGSGRYRDSALAQDDNSSRGGRAKRVVNNLTSRGRNKGKQSMTSTPMSASASRDGSGKKNRSRKGKGGSGKKKGGMVIQRWPYDDYHTTQAEYYKSLEENGGLGDDMGMAGLANGLGRDSDDEINYRSGSDDEGTSNKRRNQHMDDGSKFYERPPELPSIKEAVNGLSLVDFERKAEERAIGIVSTWLFDAGLIDELLVNGAVRSSYPGVGPSLAGSMMSHSGEDRSVSVTSVKSNEGVEVGAHGFPIGVDGGLKMDKEIEKLRAGAQRELSLINARLNDGVAASGAEVQELVNAVAATKGDLGRLRELSTYISNGCKNPDGEPIGLTAMGTGSDLDVARDEFLLANFPNLKRAIHARRNLFRCFRELEFFSQIPSTCDRLREELHSGEWTANEWSTIRSVCMEHVELEILLVEAEAGMKARIDYEGEQQESDGNHPPGRGLGAWSSRNMRYMPSSRSGMSFTPGNYEAVDKFLSAHVKNVWELGEEIRMRILSGIGSSFDLALNNPAGMVALVEAVEVYERAAEQYKALEKEDEEKALGAVTSARPGNSGGKERQTLRFTDMRAAALAQLYQDFELRGLEVFRAIHMQAADTAEEEDALNSQFTGVLRAATELVSEIDLVKNDMAPCFAPHWAVEVLWSSCVAHVCSNQILQQIGGPDGHNLPDLTVTQLLDLVAWVEYFRETIEEAFPHVASMHSKRTYFDQRPDLFAGDKKNVDMDSATDSLAWVNNMLWEVHRLAQEEFLVRTRSQTDEWLDNVYEAEHEKTQMSDGRLQTSLCEDVFSLAGVQLRTIRERLSRKSDALIMAVCLIFSHLRSKQIHARDRFLQDLETCCAAANDFIRMSEKCEDVMSELLQNCDFGEDSISTLEASSSELLALYSNDAVYAAQSVHIYIFEPIRDAIAEELFGSEWEENLSHNELALTLVRTLEDFMGDLDQYLDELMVRKTVDALVSATVIFYIKCLLLKAENHASVKVACFSDIEKALERVNGDIKVMRDYFEGLVESMPSLGRHIEKEFEILTTIHECMAIAGGQSESDASDFILVLQKRVRDIDITKHVVGDLWHLVAPTQERAVWELVESMEMELTAIAPTDDAAYREAHERSSVPGLRLDEMMAKLYIDSKRKRPVKASALEKMVTTWKANWTTDDTAPET